MSVKGMGVCEGRVNLFKTQGVGCLKFRVDVCEGRVKLFKNQGFGCLKFRVGFCRVGVCEGNGRL